MKKILLDAGHGGTATGATVGDITEKSIALDVTLETGKILKRQLPDADIYYTRIQDKNLSLTGRYQAIMDMQPDVFISIHCNSIGDNPNTSYDEREIVHGVEIFYRDDRDLSLAQAVNRLFLRSDIWKRNRGIKQDQEWLGKRLTVLNCLEIPSILVEIGFISNTKELLRILEYKSGIADLLAHGIMNFLEKKNE